MEKVTYVWKYMKVKLYQPWTDNDSCRLRVISHLYWRSNSEVFVHVWLSLDKSISFGEFPVVYNKWVLCKVYNHDFGFVTSSTLQLLFRVFRMRFSLSLPRACMWYANQLRNGMKGACASADCVPYNEYLREAVNARCLPGVKIEIKWFPFHFNFFLTCKYS